MKKTSVKTKFFAVGIAAVILAGALFVGGMTVLEWDFAKLDYTTWESKTYNAVNPSAGFDEVDIECPRASVEIVSGDVLNIEYEESDRVTYTIEESNGRLTVREHSKFLFRMFEFRSPVMKITLPTTERLKLSIVNGSTVLENTSFEKLEIATVNGSIELKNIDIKGVCNAGTVNGKINFTNVTAEEINASNINGALYVQDVVSVRTALSTVNGRIKAENMSAERITMETVNGDINCGFTDPEELYAIECSTLNGSVNVRDKETGTRKIIASTVNGDIEMKFFEKAAEENYDEI